MNAINTRKPQDMIDAEREHIAGGRKRQGISGDYSALALSGGGIRSASFGLGVMQALVSASVLKKLDYLSTVSGGGYIGSSLTWFLHNGLPDDRPAGTDASNFPFGQPNTGARTAEGADGQQRDADHRAAQTLRWPWDRDAEGTSPQRPQRTRGEQALQVGSARTCSGSSPPPADTT